MSVNTKLEGGICRSEMLTVCVIRHKLCKAQLCDLLLFSGGILELFNRPVIVSSLPIESNKTKIPTLTKWSISKRTVNEIYSWHHQKTILNNLMDSFWKGPRHNLWPLASGCRCYLQCSQNFAAAFARCTDKKDESELSFVLTVPVGQLLFVERLGHMTRRIKTMKHSPGDEKHTW